MKRAALALCLCCCAPANDAAPALSDVPPSTLSELDIGSLEGKWFVTISSAPFWMPPKEDAIIEYAVIEQEADQLATTIRFNVPAGARSISGVGRVDAELAGHVRWQGEGLFHTSVAHRYFVAVDEQWAISYIGASNHGAGPGVEVLMREPCPPSVVEGAVLKTIFLDPFLAPRSTNLYRIVHDACSQAQPLPLAY